MKRTVFYLSLIAFIFYLVGRFFLLDAAAQSHDRLFALVALLVYPLAASLCALIAWILGLIQTAKTGRWGWFAVVFFLPVLGSLIYGFFGPEDQPAMPMMQQAQWQTHTRLTGNGRAINGKIPAGKMMKNRLDPGWLESAYQSATRLCLKGHIRFGFPLPTTSFSVLTFPREKG